MKAKSVCTLRLLIAICCLVCSSCSPTATTGGGASFSEDDYEEVTRQFAEAISLADYDRAWTLASQHLESRTDRDGLEETCESFFEQLGRPTGIREVGINAADLELPAAFEELESTVPAKAAKAWCVASFQAEKDINVGVILVDDSGALTVGDYWLYDD